MKYILLIILSKITRGDKCHLEQFAMYFVCTCTHIFPILQAIYHVLPVAKPLPLNQVSIMAILGKLYVYRTLHID